MKLVRFLFKCIILNLSLQICHAQSWLWAKQPFFTGNPSSQAFGDGRTLAADKSGNVYETGYFGFASMVYGTDTLVGPVGNVFLSKYDTSGNLIWARSATLPNEVDECTGYAVTTDINGNVYVAGSFYDNVIIGTTNLTGTTNGEEVFVAKYDPNGNVLWARQSTPVGASSYNKYGYGVATDKNANVYVTGEFVDSITFGSFTLTSPYPTDYYPSDVFLVKYDSSGNPEWARQGVKPTIYCFATNSCIATDDNNNVYLSGQFYDTLAFGTEVLKSNSLAGDIYLAKYDENGNVKWARQSTNHSAYSFLINGNSIATDKAGSVYLAGSFGDTISFDAVTLSNPVPTIYSYSYGDLLLVKYDSSGNVVWGKEGAPQSNFSCTAYSVAVDNFNHVYVAAAGTNDNSNDPINFSIGLGSQVFNSAGPASYYFSLLVELDTAGNTLCGSAAPIAFVDWVTTDPTGQYVYMGGGFLNKVTLGTDSLTLDNNPPNEGTSIPFVVRWQPCDVVVSIPLSASASKTDVTCNGLCNGTAMAAGSGGTPPYTYLWDTHPADTTQTITGLCTGAYNVTITDNTGATATSGVTIMQPAAIVITIIVSKDTICSGDSTQICTSGNFSSYSWNTGDTTKCTSGKAAGEYYVMATDTNGCTAESNHVSISEYPVPSVSIILNGDTLSSFGSFSYQWLLNGNPISNATGPVCVAAENGLYSVQVTDSNGCMATSNPVNVIFTGFDDLTKENISLYPNPSTGSWQLTVSNNLLDSEMEVYDEQGRLVSQSQIRNLKSEINLNVAKGIYYLRISNASLSLVKMLVKI